MILQLAHINTYYDRSHILWDVSLEVKEGEIATIIGRNGAGKSTTVHSIMGLIRPRSGKIFYKDQDITSLPSFKISRLGIGFVPEDRRLFPNLTLEENLILATIPLSSNIPPKEQIKPSLDLFPTLQGRLHRTADTFSGGEQQMIAIARALIGNPKLILLDEPFEGLAPLLVKELMEVIREIQAAGTSMLLVGQNFQASLDLGERHYIMDVGRICYEATTEDLEANKEVQLKYLGVS